MEAAREGRGCHRETLARAPTGSFPELTIEEMSREGGGHRRLRKLPVQSSRTDIERVIEW